VISILIEVFDCYTKFIATLQLTIRLGSIFKHQKVLWTQKVQKSWGIMTPIHSNIKKFEYHSNCSVAQTV